MGNNLLEQLAFFVSYPLAIFALLFLAWRILKKKKGLINNSVLIFSAIFSAWFFSNLIKMLTVVDRPFVRLGIEPLYHEPSFSFPSTHSTIFFALAMVVYEIDKKLSYIFFVFAGLVAFSRILLDAHYIVDVVAGALLGVLLGYLLIKLFRKIK